MNATLISDNVTDNRFDNDAPVSVFLSEYQDGIPAIYSVDEIGLPFATYSVNLSGYGIMPLKGDTFIKDYNEGEGGIDVLIENNIVEKVSDTPVVFGPFNTKAWEVKIIKK